MLFYRKSAPFGQTFPTTSAVACCTMKTGCRFMCVRFPSLRERAVTSLLVMKVRAWARIRSRPRFGMHSISGTPSSKRFLNEEWRRRASTYLAVITTHPLVVEAHCHHDRNPCRQRLFEYLPPIGIKLSMADVGWVSTMTSLHIMWFLLQKPLLH